MKNPLPDTIAFRATALLVVGLAFTHLVSNLFYATDRETVLLAAGGEHAIQWVATVGSFSDGVSDNAWSETVSRVNTENLFVQVMDAPFGYAAAEGGWRDEALRRELGRHVPDAQLSSYRISYVPAADLGQNQSELTRYFTDENGNLPQEFILVSLDLGNGKWLGAASPVLPSPTFFSARLGLSMAVMLVFVVAISALIVRRMTLPLKQLSEAAEKLGTDVQAPAITESGPAEVRRTAHAFNVMQNRIRRFVEDRTQMLGAIAHDLGTPITRLRLRAEFVEENELRRKMLRDLDDMQEMVASTLAFIREDAAQEPRVRVDIGSLLARVCDDISDAGFEVTLADIPRWQLVDCHPVSLRRALSNVIDNAVKYGHSAQVSMVVEETVFKILVEDNGPGIAEHLQEDVFRPFLRLEESRNRETGGTGLGLSVARTILRGHGGDIRLHNREEGGLCVELRLPLTKDMQSDGAPKAKADASAESGLMARAKSGQTTCKPNEGRTTWKTL